MGIGEPLDNIMFLARLLGLGKNQPLDDSKLQLEMLVQIMTKLPPDSRLLLELEKLFVSLLWSDISKPPTMLANDYYRSADDPSINKVSSYLDLSPLYGRNVEEQMSVRQGRLGLLKPDTFFDQRIILQPPGVCSFLILFSRNHNYIAKRLLQINERERFSVKNPNDKEELKVQDENLFQTARLIN
ncbi:12861_t:CDS:2, partial [Acaulospora colombiana]